MAGNSSRRGAVRRPGSKKGPLRGTGGHGRKALEGKGPTPKAEDRPYHPAAKRKAAADRQASRERGRRSYGDDDPRKEAGGRSQYPRTNPGGPPHTRTGGPHTRTGGPHTNPGGPPRTNTGGPRTKSARPYPAETDTPVEGPDSTLVVGRNAVLEALRAGVPSVKLEIAATLESDPRLQEILVLAAEASIPISEVGPSRLDRRTAVRHQGVALTVQEYRYSRIRDLLRVADDAGQPALIVALDSVTDPHNLGAVIRSAAAFGAHGVLVPVRRAAGVTATTWKVSAGAAARLPVARATNLVQALLECKKAGCTVIGLEGRGSLDISEVTMLADPAVIVLGAEDRGLGRLVRETCDMTARITISERTESLNASVAAGIALHAAASARRAAR